jgi:hypothetical protein
MEAEQEWFAHLLLQQHSLGEAVLASCKRYLLLVNEDKCYS